MCPVPGKPDYVEVDQADGTVSRFQVFRPGMVYPADAELVRSLVVRQELSDLEVRHHDGTVSLFRLRDVRMVRYRAAAAGIRVDRVEAFLEQLCRVPGPPPCGPLESNEQRRQNRELIAERAREVLGIYRKERQGLGYD